MKQKTDTGFQKPAPQTERSDTMKELGNTKIIAVDLGYGNIKTANTLTPTTVEASREEPVFGGNILELDGMYYRIGEGHKEFIHNKETD